MIFNEVFEEIKKTEVYKKEMENKNAYLAHFFAMPQSSFNPLSKEMFDLNSTEIHIGMYNVDTKKIFSFKYLNGSVDFMPEEDLFQKEEAVVVEIKLEDILIDIKTALLKCANLTLEKYSDTVSLKTMIVLQNIGDHGLVWNITILRRDFKTLNFKIDAKTGEVKSESLASLIQDVEEGGHGKK